MSMLLHQKFKRASGGGKPTRAALVYLSDNLLLLRVYLHLITLPLLFSGVLVLSVKRALLAHSVMQTGSSDTGRPERLRS